MSVRLWRNWNPHTLQVGLSNGPATVELPQKAKIKLSYDSAVSPLGVYPEEMQRRTQTATCMPLFPAMSFTITQGGHNTSGHQQM